MAQFRKKPVTVEAIQWIDRDDIFRVVNWLAQQEANISGWLFSSKQITINGVSCCYGDWIVKDAEGFHPCSGRVFQATYDPVQ